MEQFIEETRLRCQYCGIDYLPVLTDENLGAVLSSYLHNRQYAGAKTHRGRMSSLGSQSRDEEQRENMTDNSPAPENNHSSNLKENSETIHAFSGTPFYWRERFWQPRPSLFTC